MKILTCLCLIFGLATLGINAEEKSKVGQWWKKFKNVPVKPSEETIKGEALSKSNDSPTQNTNPFIKKNKKPELKKWGIRFDLSLLDPDLSEWSTYYDDNMVFNYGLEGNYYLTENWSMNFGLNYLNTEGQGVLGNTGNLGTTVDYTLIPYHLGFQYEQIYPNHKMIRPFCGAGYAYAQYSQKPSSGSNVKGHEDGYYVNLGVMLNFYNLESVQKSRESHFENFYWVLEAERLWLKSDAAGVDLGGLNYSFGIKLRF